MQKNKRIMLKVVALIICLFLLIILYPNENKREADNIKKIKEDIEEQLGEEASTKEQESEPELLACQKQEIPETIRVLIMNDDYAGIYHSDVKIHSNSGFKVTKMSNGVTEEKKEKDIKASTLISKLDERVCIEPTEPNDEMVLGVKRNQRNPKYDGCIMLKKTEDGYIVVNKVKLEEYLKKVVPSEMPSDYPLEALKAQAVCARSYSCRFILNPAYPEHDADVNDSVDFQVYNNIGETENTNTAINETKGVIMKYAGLPTDSFYYSTSCGVGTVPQIWKEKEPIDRPYLISNFISSSESVHSVSVNDLTDENTFREYILSSNENDFDATEPWYRWSYVENTLNTDKMEQRINERSRMYPELVLVWNTKTASYENISDVNIGKVKDISVKRRLTGGVIDELCIVTDTYTIKIIGENNVRYCLADGESCVIRNDGSQVDIINLLPSAFFCITTKKNAKGYIKGYTLNGGGYGHGVGMSQNGAKHAAEAGYDCRKILGLFYSEVEYDVLW